MSEEPIAIIGSACRFPGGADTPSRLWDILEDPSDLRREIPPDRFNISRYYHPDSSHHGTSNVRHSYFLEDDFKRFDSGFFGVKVSEASAMDPQQRLLLETVYEGLESAGLPMHNLQGSQTAVFVGNMSADYIELLSQDVESFPTYFAPGTARSILSNRISYFFDWHGPSVTIDTACSSSLVALHQAVQSLRSGEANLAVAAGTNLLLTASQYVAESKLKMLSPDGLSKMWDESADGYARGEGIAAILLKPLSHAIRDGDHIECIVRETGTNQDGRTKGITMPNPASQAALIQDTYRRAGLDLSRPSDRPQYFEAHGTGTPAGDPVEAEAINTAFYGPDSGYEGDAEGIHDSLLVGSIKTIIGHTEGTAGLASVLKVSLAMQHGRIPPNLHLNRLSPTVQPHARHLNIPTTLQDWPLLPGGAVRRASVNSFGFGGANAHAILEAYTPAAGDVPVPSSAGTAGAADFAFAPFLFSAVSDSALAANIAAHADYIEAHPQVDLRDVSYTLHSHRSTLHKRSVFAETSRDALLQKLRAYTAHDKTNSAEAAAARSLQSKPRSLGVFTGQGAQWPRMGAELVEHSVGACAILDVLEESLATLPVHDRPTWTLREELLAPPDQSRVHEAELSQPLCTALQILLVEALRHAGVTFDAVIGHSSGEIGAAYAAGVLTASDAIRIAYYRGFHVRRCRTSANGQAGAMMAVGTSYDDAIDFCALDDFQGRLCVAASNSPSSITLSGDADAVQEAGVVFGDEGRFFRALKVDKAYHSHHMEPCLEPYIRSLKACGISPTLPSGSDCTWVSSVYADDVLNVKDDFASAYWANNMARTVLFSQACEAVLREAGPFDQVIEVGPHPALKGPAGDVIQDTVRDKIPYFGTLIRNQDAVVALAQCVGGLWEANGSHTVDLERYEGSMSGSRSRTLLTDLPRYQWDHQTQHYHDPHRLRAIRGAYTRPNEIIGTRMVEEGPSHAQWRNRLATSEVPWLSHHQVQGQSVFPAAGYIAAAIEAARELFSDVQVSVVQVKNFVVGQALIIPDGRSTEIVTILTNIVQSTGTITARFSFSAEDGRSDSVAMTEKASGDIILTVGDLDPDALPPRPDPDFNMLAVDHERFYNAVTDLGFGYTGPFKALRDIHRKMDVAVGFIEHPEATDGFGRLLIHPAALDAAIQSIILACCFPGDTRIRSVHLPTKIDSIRLNLPACESGLTGGSRSGFRSSVPTGGVELKDINGDVDLYAEDGTTILQLQGLHTTPLVPPTAGTDLNPFFEFTWGDLEPRGRSLILEGEEARSERILFEDIERAAYFYMRHLDQSIPRGDRIGLPVHQSRLFKYLDDVFRRAERGELEHIVPQWKDDDRDVIQGILARHPGNIDLEIIHAVGENFSAVIRGEINMLEPLVQDNRLDRFYVNALGMPRYIEDLSRMSADISNRFPHLQVLEVGAGTGGATKVVLSHLANAFDSYFYTDISSGFFDAARQTFHQHASKMTFQTLNIEDVSDQGFGEKTFDLVIANLVVHATKNLEATMANLRRLIKPGGYLLLLEITNNDQVRLGFIFGGLPGWWLGEEDDRQLSPCVNVSSWDRVMRQTGFSGVDAVTTHVPTCPLSVILTQAVDDKVSLLREPLSPFYSQAALGMFSHLTILGADENATGYLQEELETVLSPYFGKSRVIRGLSDLATQELPVMGSVLSLVDLGTPVFEAMTAEKLRSFQKVFEQSSHVLWVTVGANTGNPTASMILGVARNIMLEMPHLRLQVLDLEQLAHATPNLLSEALLRFTLADVWWDEPSKCQDVLWTNEPELRYDQGRLRMPRMRPSSHRNLRYSAGRRDVSWPVDARTTPLALTREGSSETYALTPAPLRSASGAKLGTVALHVSRSILRSVRLASSDVLFILGGSTDDGKCLVALSESQASVVDVNRDWTVEVCPAMDEEALERAMLALHDVLLAQTLLAGLDGGSYLVVMDASDSLVSNLKNIGGRRGIGIVSLICSTVDHPGKTVVHPFESTRSIRSKLPARFDRLASFKITQKTHVGLWEAIVSGLRANHGVELWQTLTASESTLSTRTSLGVDVDIPNALRAAWMTTNTDPSHVDIGRVLRIGVASASSAEGQAQPGSACLVDWTLSTPLPMRVHPALTTVGFSGHKTYWLVGLTGGLGQSLCRWMVDRGARYIVMTSRSPKVDKRWLADIQSYGAVVRVFANDVTSRDAVQLAYKSISATMPPIGGVAQGAMVLHDTMFAEMSLERMRTVVGPKVDGSLHLEELFHDAPLEFFVFFSSVAAITGNRGQSMYAAANMFMNTLAAQRRERGVAGSVIHLGAVMGNGYIARELTPEQQKFLLENVCNVWLSEQDFLTAFAEGVIAGRPGSGETCETTMGLQMLSTQDEKLGWTSDVRFQHLVVGSEASAAVSVNKQGNTPIKTQLEAAHSWDDVSMIIDNAFSFKLRSMLQISAEQDILDSAMDQIGIDSLIAVDIRSWFLKELSADVPVLEILNSGTPRILLEPVKKLVADTMATPPQPSNTKAVGPELAKTAGSGPEQDISPVRETNETTIPRLIDAGAVSESTSSTGDSGSNPPDSNELGSADTPSAPSTPTLQSADTKTGYGADIGLDPSLDGSTRVTADRAVALSFGQARFWFLRHFVPDKSAFNITATARLNGRLDVQRLARAIRTVAQHHEALRTAFVSRDSGPVQLVLKSSSLELEHRQIAGTNEFHRACEETKGQIYDLEAGQTMRMQLLSLSPTAHFFILGYHHINMDGLSFEVLLSDINKAYQGEPFTTGVLQYPDLSIREHGEHRDGRWEPQLEFWRRELHDPPGPLPLLPMASRSSRPPVPRYRTIRLQRRVPASVSSRLKTTLRKFKAGAFAFYLTVVKALIARYVGVRDICIGMADANRRQGDVLESLGLYVNSVPLRVTCDPKEPFGDAMEKIQTKFQLAFSKAGIPFDVLLNELDVARTASFAPLFQVFVNYRQGVSEVRDFCGCVCEGELLSGGEVPYDLSFDIVENPGGDANVMLSVQQGIYDEASAAVLLESFAGLVEAFAINPASRMNKPRLYAQPAVDQGLRLGTGPTFEHVWPGTVAHRIQDMVRQYSDRPALATGAPGGSLTYAEMDTSIETISAMLEESTSIGEAVGVLQSPTPLLVCSTLAVLKTGRVLVPLDMRLGVARLAATLREARPTCLLVDQSTQDESRNVDIGLQRITFINVTGAELPRASPGANRGSETAARAADPAAIIYTSGSTGTPKGISLSHDSILNNIEIATRQFSIGEGTDVVLHQTAPTFDMSLFQVLLGLCNGCLVVVAPHETRGDPAALASLMLRTGVSVTAATPAEYLGLARHGASDLRNTGLWRLACSGGDRVTEPLIEAFRSLSIKDLVLFNAYGPAETSFFCSGAPIPYQESSARAHADTPLPLETLPDYAVYIVSDDLTPVPLGVSGEICIAGAGVGLGYSDNAPLTSAMFPPNPYASEVFKSRGWTRMHRTGDLGRLGQDGRLTLQGRIGGDSQVKLNGIRVDVQEVELALLRESGGGLVEAGVSVRAGEAAGGDFLVAHVVLGSLAAGGGRNELGSLPGRLGLPQYMKPSVVVPVPSLPLNNSNKLDRLALRSLPIGALPAGTDGDGVGLEEAKELSPAQEKVRALWERVVPRDLISRHSLDAQADFFRVGGTSLQLIELQAQFRSEFGTAPSVQRLFQSPTLQGMAEALDAGPSSGPKDGNHVSYDWEAEAALLPDWEYDEPEDQPGRATEADADADADAAAAEDGTAIVLTGATGFLGRHILERLLGYSTVARVYCIAVRKPISELPPLFRDGRVEVLHGDLAARDLGLSPADTRRVFSRARAVIHNGADVSFMKTYASLRPTNVEATKRLARLAVRHGVPLHFVSSAAVTQLTPLDQVGEASVSDWPPPSPAPSVSGQYSGTGAAAAVVDGYIAAKWVSERHLELLAARGPAHITIHRPSSIMGNTTSDTDLMGSLLRFVELLEAVPEGRGWRGYFDLVSVGAVAGAIARAVMGDMGGGAASDAASVGGPKHVNGVSAAGAPGARLRYQYEAGEIVYPLSTMADVAAQSTESGPESQPGGPDVFPVATLPLEEWVAKAEERGLNPLLAVYLRDAAARNSRWAFPKLVKGQVY